MNDIILHIPHSSLVLPHEFWTHVICDKNIVDEFNKNITDLYIDKLFFDNKYKSIIAPYSRTYCDIERFADDDKEVMTRFGMGFVYSHTNQGQKFLQPTAEYKQQIYNDYYQKWHKNLDNIIGFSSNKSIILIDCHSFSKDIIMFEDKKENLPDICIGYDELYYNRRLVEFIKLYFEKYGYLVNFNYPYMGTMIPDKCLISNFNNLTCLMLEINKALYLNVDNSPNEHFEILKNRIQGLLKALERFE